LKDVAADSTGLEDRHTSHHFRKRREETAKSAVKPGKPAKQRKSPFPKIALLCDCLSHLTLSLRTDRGPCSDHKYFRPLLDDAAARFTITRLLADAGFDSEALIPAAIGRPTAKPPSGRHRRRMKLRWSQYKKRYGQRWQVETVNSMLKRLLGSALRARQYWSRSREMTLRLLTLNVMILATVD